MFNVNVNVEDLFFHTTAKERGGDGNTVWCVGKTLVVADEFFKIDVEPTAWMVGFNEDHEVTIDEDSFYENRDDS